MIDFVHAAGVVAMGILTPEILTGVPPSTDFKRILLEAKSAVTFAMALNRDGILRPVSPGKSWAHLDAMDVEMRALYE